MEKLQSFGFGGLSPKCTEAAIDLYKIYIGCPTWETNGNRCGYECGHFIA